MKATHRINKVLSALIFPLVILYWFFADQYSPIHNLLYYNDLIGFNNTHKTVTENTEALTILFLCIFSIPLLIRFLDGLEDLGKISKRSIAQNISRNISNVLDIIFAYFYINICMTIVYTNNSSLLIILAIILGVGFVIWKISEITSTTEGNRDGAFNVLATATTYLKESEDYGANKTTLQRNYKNLVS